MNFWKRKFIIKNVQLQCSDTETFKINKKQLNAKVSEEGLYQYFGRIQGGHHIFISKESVLAETLVEGVHILPYTGDWD